MSKEEVWNPLPSFEMTPGQTFFGLDKNKSYCFTLPKQIYEKYISFFNLRDTKLQHQVSFLINDKRYFADLRLVQQNRSKIRKLKKGDLPERIVLQFGWKKYKLTQFSIQDNLRNTYEKTKNGNDKGAKVRFTHIKGDVFLLTFLKKTEERLANFLDKT